MAVSQEFAAMLSQALDAAARCAANETSDNYSVLGERLGELETLADRRLLRLIRNYLTAGVLDNGLFEDSPKKSLQSNVPYQPLVTKLQNGTPLTAEELGTLRSLIVGDAGYYLKYDDDFDRSKSELSRILDQIRQLQSGEPDVSKLMHVGVLCREAATLLASTEHYLEQKERVRRFEQATRGPIDREAGRTLAGIIEGMAA